MALILQIVGHPLRRMTQRGVTRDDIQHALENYVTRTPLPGDNSVKFIGPGVSGADLKVWVLPPGDVKDGSIIVVKSVAWRGVSD